MTHMYIGNSNELHLVSKSWDADNTCVNGRNLNIFVHVCVVWRLRKRPINATGFWVHPLNLRPIRGMSPPFHKYFKEKIFRNSSIHLRKQSQKAVWNHRCARILKVYAYHPNDRKLTPKLVSTNFYLMKTIFWSLCSNKSSFNYVE